MDKWSVKVRGREDELALVKAAAWAWYQHGPGSDGRPLREFNISTRITNRPQRPSRYKLEAMARENKNRDQDHDHDQERSLLDEYEVRRISLQLDRLIESSSRPEEKRAGSGKKEKERKRWRGLWGRPRVTCGTREDVVESCRKCAAGQGRLVDKASETTALGPF